MLPYLEKSEGGGKLIERGRSLAQELVSPINNLHCKPLYMIPVVNESPLGKAEKRMRLQGNEGPKSVALRHKTLL